MLLCLLARPLTRSTCCVARHLLVQAAHLPTDCVLAHLVPHLTVWLSLHLRIRLFLRSTDPHRTCLLLRFVLLSTPTSRSLLLYRSPGSFIVVINSFSTIWCCLFYTTCICGISNLCFFFICLSCATHSSKSTRFLELLSRELFRQVDGTQL